jgi:tripartite-type tricarboxylate transporter receptor subunit TctC
MEKARIAAAIMSCAIAGLVAAPAYSQTYPTKPVRIITSPAGGGNDFPARLIARAVTAPLGQQVIVDNRATVLIADVVAKAPPDGYTLLVTGSAHWIGPLVDKVNYDPIRDFAPITLIDRSPSVLVVHPSMPVKSVKQLVALAKAKPGELNFSVGGPGTSNFLAAIMFNQMAGVNVVRIPYKGTGPALAAVMTGEVHAMFGSAGGAAPHVKSGRLRALAVGSMKPSPLAPGVPTIDSSGIPGFVSEALHAMFAPAGTPQPIVARLNQEVSRYLQSAEAQDIFLKAGIDTAPGTPDELTSVMKSEISKFGPMLKAAGIGPH